MFVLSAGLVRTGAVRFAGRALLYLAKRSLTLTLLGLMLGVALFSAFLNNTAAVAILIPVIIGVAREAKTSASKLLMPLSFASMFGGVSTLIGTSTNILGATIAERHGQPAFGMFEFLPRGLVFVVAGTAYMRLLGTRLIPERRGEGDLAETFAIADYLTEVVLLDGGVSVGRRLDEAPLLKATSPRGPGHRAPREDHLPAGPSDGAPGGGRLAHQVRGVRGGEAQRARQDLVQARGQQRRGARRRTAPSHPRSRSPSSSWAS